MLDTEIRVYQAGTQAVTASWHDPKAPYKNRATVDLSGLGDPEEWWVNRALVQGPRGTGIGSNLLQLALKKAVELGATRVRVCPGGYDSKPEDQQRFYEKNGFVPRRVGKHPEEIVWEWRP